MPRQFKIFRVFVSSTFIDMKQERWILQRDVFPKLEKYCEENNARFQAVDLRWGVNEESQLNQKTVDICLNEISRCQKLSPRPNFLILLGNRYGWQPVPAKIPETEMDEILSQLEEKNKALIKEWYKLDTNAIPAEYILQPRGEKYKQYSKWEKVEKEIKEILRKAVDKLGFSDEQRVKYFASATHQEIIRGALNPPTDIDDPEEHVFAFAREIRDLPQDETAKDYIEIKEGKPDEESKTALDNLKKELKSKLGDHYVNYDADWKDNKSQIRDPEKFAEDVYVFLHDIIKEQLESTISNDEIEQEIKRHKAFKDILVEHFRGREETLNNINNYLNNAKEMRVLSLIGESGSGKSSVMAEAVIRTENKNQKGVIVYRFIGVTSTSTNIISLLRSICGEIAGNFDQTLESIAGRDQEKSLYEIYGLSEVLSKCLGLATTDKPIKLFLDALNQLSDTDNAKALYWLPRELPENVKIVASSLPNLKENLSDTLIENLPLLPEQEAREILKKWFASIHRTLTDKQFNEVIKSFNLTKLAIYLKVTFEIAKHWHSYKEDFVLQDNIKGLITDYFDYLEKEEHDADFVRTSLSYMLCGKYMGLTESEILEILVFDEKFWNDVFLRKVTHPDHRQELVDLKEYLESEKNNKSKVAMKIPIVVWSRLFHDLEAFLTEIDADGVPIITFFHQQFFEVLKERYNLIEEVGEFDA